MKVTTLDETAIHGIGHAFGYYDYGQETGMTAAFSGKAATEDYICAYVRGMLRGGKLAAPSPFDLMKRPAAYACGYENAPAEADEVKPEQLLF